MALVPEQDLFLQDVAKLLEHAKTLGFVVTGGELYRTVEQQRIHVREGRSKTMNSQHLKRLAIDLNFFVVKDGDLSLCYDKPTLQAVGDFWESLSPANRWGGNWTSFKDTPHFERRDGVGGAPEHERAAPAVVATGPRPPVPAPLGQDETIRTLLADAVGEKKANRRDDVESVQRLLNAAHEAGRCALPAPLKCDGVFGSKTLGAIEIAQKTVAMLETPDGVVTPGASTERALRADLAAEYSHLLLSLTMLAAADEVVANFVAPIRRCMDRYEINTPLREAHFLAQIGHESGELRFREEIASGAAYEFRRDLGNVKAGDGRKFKGRGLIQLTGRSNYDQYATAMDRPELLDTPEIVATDDDLCVDVAGWFWRSRDLNAKADRDDFLGITKTINGGTNGVDHRRALLTRAKALYGLD